VLGQVGVAVPNFSPYPCSRVICAAISGGDPGQVVGVEREAVLVLLGRRPDDAEAEETHFFLVPRLSEGLPPLALSRLSARFSLMDLLVFLVMPCRGDLSAIGTP
jgi:hypothetical protein